jgi:molecular chaperone GrpE
MDQNQSNDHHDHDNSVDEGHSSTAGDNIDYKVEYLRALAELENTRKRFEKEKEDTQKYAVSQFSKDLLAVYDNLERAIVSCEGDQTTVDTIKKGVLMTLDQLTKIFEKYHIFCLNPIGEKFDPHYHQAIMEIESDEHAPQHIIQVLQKGYTINNRLLRPVMVGVSKPKTS